MDQFPDSLTARERDCLRLAETCTDKEIAAELGIAVSTVKTHLGAARRKIGVSVSRPRAARLPMASADAPPWGSSTARPMVDPVAVAPSASPSDHPIGADAEQAMVREERAVFGHQPRLIQPAEARDDLTLRYKALWLLATPLALAALILIVLAIFGEFDTRVLPHFYPHYHPG